MLTLDYNAWLWSLSFVSCDVFFFNSNSGGGGESNWVQSERRAPNGLLYLPRVIMGMEKLVEWWLAGETDVLGENLPQCHVVDHKSHIIWPGAKPGRRGGKPATNRLSCDTAYPVVFVLVQAEIQLRTINKTI
jgi:hypothetical protein